MEKLNKIPQKGYVYNIINKLIDTINNLITSDKPIEFISNEYYDRDKRLLFSRLENGDTILYDEHENPIILRTVDGTTKIFDAYQSGRVLIDEHGNVTFNTSISQGNCCEATGVNSHAEGYGCKASGACSHAEGTATEASGQGAHAEGSSSQTEKCIASGENSHAEGLGCRATGKNSHAEGRNCVASGEGSHAEGIDSVAMGNYGHAEGYHCEAQHYGHAEGYRTVISKPHEHAQGTFNVDVKVDGAFMHGCGVYGSNKNAFVIAGAAVYILGIGGYDGTNYGQEGVLSLQEVILGMVNG